MEEERGNKGGREWAGAERRGTQACDLPATEIPAFFETKAIKVRDPASQSSHLNSWGRAAMEAEW